ncbi:hypothetical protein FGE12_06810 [Aggregicoccus sp. 17bor-14]|uniref:hypothetical protein n=1 Tax=Myxococcaceae TaxID=31 RepID=UPI00129C187E|nr:MULTISPECIES: hypothetical protein [Myxococcaceae]MBF5042099.1 hypothetical protein [Simulacricoccus sp. 17bor-14]MRI87876.1 hypothetical protein [Aggregicoccus sp. 17bor-14]
MRLLLPALLASLLCAGCATVPTRPPPSTCAEGNAGLCRFEATQHLARGERPQAVEALGRGCGAGLVTDCVEQGELLLEDGQLDAAEPPLERAKQEGWSGAYAPLARLHEARATPADLATAHQLRRDVLSIDHPDAEVLWWYRASEAHGPGAVLALNIQPMWARSRRLNFGVQWALTPNPTELTGFVGYQHFATDWLVPYANVQAGWGSRGYGESGFFDAGVEGGVKLALGPLGHLNFAVGSSRGSPLHLSVGVGLNYLLVLAAAAAH